MSSTGAEPPIADVAWGQLDGECKAISTPGTHFFGKSGHVKVTTLSATEVAGEWDVEYDSGQKQTGTFRVPICGAQPSYACTD